MAVADMWKLSIEDDQGQSTIVQLVRGEYSIGRTEENTIRLTERNLSRHHARLVRQGTAWFLDDLGSYNGCFVNGVRVVGQHPLHPSDLIQLGDYRLELHTDEVEAQSAAQALPNPRPEALSTTLNLSSQADRFVMVVGPTPGREFLLAHATQRIGRGEECDICVNHSSVSRWHADLNFIGSGRYEVIDHGSSNGIRINGVELARGLIDSHDLLELGDVVLKFIPAGQVYRPSPEETRQLAALLGVEVEGPPASIFERASYVWRSMSTAARLGALFLGAGVIVLFSFVANRKMAARSDMRAAALGPSSSVVSVENTLQEAQKRFRNGELAVAHRLLQTIPSTNPIASEPNFRLIETAWAEDVMARAEHSTSTAQQRDLLDTVIRTPTVDAVTRAKASEQLAKLDRPETAPLSSDASTPPTVASVNANGGTTTEDAISPPSDVAEVNAVPVEELERVPSAAQHPHSGGTRPSNTGSSERASQAKQTIAGHVSQPKSSNTPAIAAPAEPNTTDLATSGSLDSAKAARDVLKRKASAGTATEREKKLLRALCRQTGDTSCSR